MSDDELAEKIMITANDASTGGDEYCTWGMAQAVASALREAIPGLDALIAETGVARVRAAATALYHAAHWTPDRPCDDQRLWTELRDAIGLPPGTAPKPKGQSHD